jgi:hypothetical protein
MTKLLRAGAAFVAGAVLVTGAAYAVSEAADPVYPQLRARLELLRERSAALEAVSVGNSHNRAIDFEALGMHGVHLWRPGHDVFEAGFLGRHAAGKAPRLRHVLLSASYGFQRANNAVSGTHGASRRELYARLPLRRPIDGGLDAWVSGAVAPVARLDHWRGVVRRVRRPAPPVRMAADGGAADPLRGPLTADSVDRLGAQRAAIHRRFAAETMARAPGTPRRVARELDHLARGLEARGITLVLYTPPYHESYLRERDPAILAEGRAVLLYVARRNPNVVWLDFSEERSFARRHELFRDGEHLTAGGARRFSALLRGCLLSVREPAAAPRDPRCSRAVRGVASARSRGAGVLPE